MWLPVAACKEGDVSDETIDREPRVRLMQQIRSDARPWWVDMLLRGPADLRSVPLRVVVTVMIAGGAGCTVASGVIHLYLWGKQYGYRDVPTIGPLFLAQGIGAILIGLLVIVTRRAAAVLIAAGLLVASVIALVLAIEVGMFGFKDSWLAPYAWTSFYEEMIGGVLLLLAAAGVLCFSGKAGR
jgi:hypothetical protein